MSSWSWRSVKLLSLHLVGVPYYFTYNSYKHLKFPTFYYEHSMPPTRVAETCSRHTTLTIQYDDMIYLITAIGLTPRGGSTVHIYT
jgi:hypothetical protein